MQFQGSCNSMIFRDSASFCGQDYREIMLRNGNFPKRQENSGFCAYCTHRKALRDSLSES